MYVCIMSEADSVGGGGTSLLTILQNLNKMLIRKKYYCFSQFLHILNLPLNVKNSLVLSVCKVSYIDSGDNDGKKCMLFVSLI